MRGGRRAGNRRSRLPLVVGAAYGTAYLLAAVFAILWVVLVVWLINRPRA